MDRLPKHAPLLAGVAVVLALALVDTGGQSTPPAGMPAGGAATQQRGLRPYEARLREFVAAQHADHARYEEVEELKGCEQQWMERCAARAAAGGRPVVIRGAVSQRWSAVYQWTPSFLSSRRSEPLQAYVVDTEAAGLAAADNVTSVTVASSYSDRAWSDAPFLRPPEAQTPQTMPMVSLRDFWQASSPAPSSRDAAAYLFIKATMYNFPAGLEGGVQPNPWMLAGQQHKDYDIWMGSAGMNSAFHYDLQHNFYAQIRGQKRFLMVPVQETLRSMPLFPSIHGRHRQVAHKRRDFADVATSVLLQPGDVLYIPPYWLHSGTSLTPSLSVSTCSPSSVEKLLAQMEQLPLPLETSWPLWQRQLALKLYFAAVAQAAQLAPLPKLAAALRTRQAAVLLKPQRRTDSEEEAAAWAHCTADGGSAAVVAFAQQRTAAQASYVERMADLLRQVTPQTVRRIQWTDLMEQMAAIALGSEQVEAWVVHCLSR